MWNTRSLVPPPINSFLCISSTIDFNALTNIFENGLKYLNLNSQNILRTEYNLLCRCVYKMKLQFRNDKGFKFMEKTNSLLRKLFEFDLVNDLEFFYKSVPRKYEKKLYLPTRQMLEYLLVRVQGFAQLLKRITESALTTGRFMNSRLCLGQLWTIAAVILAIVSRIWRICKVIIKKCCMFYNDLYPMLGKLKHHGPKWLEENYEFPINLTDWLDIDWLSEEETTDEIVSKIQLEMPIYNLLDESDDDDDVQYCNEYKLLNDCYIVDDDSVEDDDEVTIVPNTNNKTIRNENKNVEYIIMDDSDTDVKKNDDVLNIFDSDNEIEIVWNKLLEEAIENGPSKKVTNILKNDEDIGERIKRGSNLNNINQNSSNKITKKKKKSKQK